MATNPSLATLLQMAQRLLSLLQPRSDLKCYATFRGGRRMYYEFRKPSRGKPTFILLHGLGDSMQDLQGLAEEFKLRGFGVLRVDLHGHGRTLEESVRRNGGTPAILDYRDQVEDIEKLVQRLRLKEVSIAGHSYGGGIALTLGTRLENQVKVISIYQMAPYVMRLDAYLNPFLSVFESRSVNSAETGQALSPGTRNPAGYWMLYDRRRSAPESPRAPSSGEASSLMDGFMNLGYRQHFLRKLGKAERDLSPEQSDLVDLQVRSAIAATKGIRDYNVFDSAFRFPARIPIHLIYGDADPLAPQGLLSRYREHLARRHYPLEATVLPGVGHFFPQEMASEVFALILKHFEAL